MSENGTLRIFSGFGICQLNVRFATNVIIKMQLAICTTWSNGQ